LTSSMWLRDFDTTLCDKICLWLVKDWWLSRPINLMCILFQMNCLLFNNTPHKNMFFWLEYSVEKSWENTKIQLSFLCHFMSVIDTFVNLCLSLIHLSIYFKHFLVSIDHIDVVFEKDITEKESGKLEGKKGTLITFSF